MKRGYKKFINAVTESILSAAEQNGIPRSILKMSFLTGYPYGTKKWKRLQYNLNRLYKDFPKNYRKIKKYIRLINKMDRSLSARVTRVYWYNIRIRQEQNIFQPWYDGWIKEEIEAGRIHVNLESIGNTVSTEDSGYQNVVVVQDDDSWPDSCT